MALRNPELHARNDDDDHEVHGCIGTDSCVQMVKRAVTVCQHAHYTVWSYGVAFLHQKSN